MSKKRLYEIIYEVSRTVNSSLDPSEVLSRIAEQVTRAMGVKGCFIRLLDRTGKVLTKEIESRLKLAIEEYRQAFLTKETR